MAEERAHESLDLEQVVASLEDRVKVERAAGAYADDLWAMELQPRRAEDARVRFRPELGFSSKPLIGPPITFAKRFLLRLQFYVLDDLARQADAAITRLERGLAVEIAMRERLETELETKVYELEDRIRLLEDRTAPNA